MKNLSFAFVWVLCSLMSLTASEVGLTNNITHQIPEINNGSGFQKISDVAQYKEADWSQVIGIAHDVTVKEAMKIAKKDDRITYFFYMKGYQMVLEKSDGSYRVFQHHDAVFFSGTPWWGSAPGFADGYIKLVE